jgi:hypothetical protein
MRRLLPLILLAVLLVTTAAHAHIPAGYEARGDFRTPSSNIYCVTLHRRSDGRDAVRCAVLSAARAGKWPYFMLAETGVALRQTDDDYPYAGIVPTIPYRATWSVVDGRIRRHPVHGAVTCTSQTAGLTCKNRAHHGFVLSRERMRTF